MSDDHPKELVVKGIVFPLQTWAGKVKCPMGACRKTYKNAHGVKQHILHSHSEPEMQQCPICHTEFNSSSNRQWYCSHECASEALRDGALSKICANAECRQEFEIRPYQMEQQYCSHECALAGPLNGTGTVEGD